MTDLPQLRPLDFQPIRHNGEQMWLLRDPMNLSDSSLVMPAGLAPMLELLDGSRPIPQIHTDFERLTGVQLDFMALEDALAALDSACLLVNDNSRQAMQIAREMFRALSTRPAALADISYPAEAQTLRRSLDGYAPDELTPEQSWRGRGIIAPHIDFQRGGDIYAKVWRRAATALRQADLILIFGTDHKDGGLFTLTPKPYNTPLGALPTDEGLINCLADSIGANTAFSAELHHRDEHSVEFSAIWLRHMLGDAPSPPMIPILCGSFEPFVAEGSHPCQNRTINVFHETLRRETAGKRVVAVASVDFAHVGANFGDPFSMDAQRRTEITNSDMSLIEAITSGDKARFYQEIADVGNKNRICGFSPIYHTLHFLGETTGRKIAYQHCSTDQTGGSLVSIAGILLD